MDAPIPADEPARLAALRGLHVLDSPAEECFERITRTARRRFGVPIVLVSLVDANRQWFKSCVGLPVAETPRSASFCAHAILGDGALVIEDARRDPRFAANPLVTGDPFIRFYAGQPLRGPGGHKLGTFCLVDRRPRRFDEEDREALADLAAWAERELTALPARHALAIVESSEDAVISKALDGTITSWNPGAARLYGYAAEEAVGQPITMLVPPDHEDEVPAILGRIGRGERIAHYETRRLTKDRRLIDVALTVSLLRDPAGRVVGASVIARDVTARKRTEVELARQRREADRLKDEFVSLVSHELRTPLTSIKGYVDLLLEGEVGELTEEQAEFLGIVGSNADRLVALVNDLLDVSRIEAGQVELHRAAVDLAGAVGAAATALRPQLAAKRQTLRLDVPGGLPPA